MRIYDLTNELKALFPLSTGEYRQLLEVMNHGGLRFLVHYLKRMFDFNSAAAFSILDHVIWRTIAFGKPLEAITIAEIEEGKISCGIPSALVSRRTLIDNLDQLVQSRLLFRIRFKQSVSQRCLYGVHFTYLIATPFGLWMKDLGEQRPKAHAARRLYERLERAAHIVFEKERHFQRLADLENPLPDFDSLLDPWRQ